MADDNPTSPEGPEEIAEEHNAKVNDMNDKDCNTCPRIPQMSHMRNRSLSRRHSVDQIPFLTPVHCSPRYQNRRGSLQIPKRVGESMLAEYRLSAFENSDNYPFLSSVGIGSELFIAFLREEIDRSHLKVPEYLSSSYRNSDSSYQFHALGAHLRLMADEFASSDHRRQVQEQAESVPLENLDIDSFTDLLFGMFQQGGVTWERILVLFVFCSDLALRALHEHLSHCFANVMCWSQLYIESWLTPWVQRHGGWVVILERSVNEACKAAIIGACMLGMVALWTYIRSAGH